MGQAAEYRRQEVSVSRVWVEIEGSGLKSVAERKEAEQRKRERERLRKEDEAVDDGESKGDEDGYVIHATGHGSGSMSTTL